MDTILRVNFDSYQFNTQFEIKNPPFLPMEGECFSARWEDFISDPEMVQALNTYEDDEIFITNLVNKHYTKDRLEVIIVLVEEKQYERFFGTKEAKTFKVLSQ
jgi:hypothetical protein